MNLSRQGHSREHRAASRGGDMSSEAPGKICAFLAAVGLRSWAAKKLASTIASFVVRGRDTPFTCVFEGEMGLGKTSLAVITCFEALAILAVSTFSRLTGSLDVEAFGLSPVVRSLSRSRVRDFSEELFDVLEAMYVDEIETVRRYVRERITFGAEEFITAILRAFERGDRVEVQPFIIADDAGLFFLRSAWISLGSAYRQAVTKLAAILQTLKSYACSLLVTTPRDKALFTRVKELMEYIVMLKRLPKPEKLVFTKSGSSIYLVTDRAVDVYRRAIAKKGNTIGETVIKIVSQEPAFFPLREVLIKPVLEDVEKVRTKIILEYARTALETIHEAFGGRKSEKENSKMQDSYSKAEV